MNSDKWRSIATAHSCRKATAPQQAQLKLETLEERAVMYAVSGNAWAAPQLITVSFVPDGTNFNGSTSNMQATFNAKFGSAATWQNVFKEAAQVWAAQTNINFNFVTDNGAPTGSGSYQQGDPNFGDIRIGGYNFGNTNLAQAFMPPPVNNYSIAGDIAFNTSQTFNIGSTYNLFTVAAHEFGHALGLHHGAVGSIMSSAYPGTLTALATDDINGIRNIYSANAARAKDSYDAAAANETFATATLVTSSINTTTKTALITDRHLSTSTDVDWYKFVLPTGSATTLKVKAVATGLSLLNPKIEIYNSSNKLQTSGTGGGYGTTATATKTSVAAGQTWYAKVSSTDAKAAFKTGKYALVINVGTGADPVVPLPNTQIANGTPLTSGGGVAVTDGAETLVNTGSTSYTQGAMDSIQVEMDGSSTPVAIATGEPVIAMDSTGNYVVVWESNGQDGSGQGIYARRYNAAGVAQGSEFRVNTTTAGNQSAPAIAMRSTGEFIITWASYGQDATNSLGIYAQRYNASGVAQGGEFRVNTTTAGDQITPAVAIDSTGKFIIAWSSYGQDAAGTWGVYAQRFDAAGVKSGSEFRANTTTAGDQMTPLLGMDKDGNYAIGWSSYNQDAANSWGGYVQRYWANGTPAFGELLINQTTAGDQRLADGAMTPTGEWMVVWTSPDGDGLGIYGRRYDRTGTAISGEFRVNTTTVGEQKNPSVTTDAYGNFYVTWQSANQDAAGSWGVYGQQFSSGGTAIGTEFLVNSSKSGDQLNPEMVMDSVGHLVVVWNGVGTGDTDGVFLQRYSVNTSQEVPPVSDIFDPDGHEHGQPETSTRQYLSFFVTNPGWNSPTQQGLEFVRAYAEELSSHPEWNGAGGQTTQNWSEDPTGRARTGRLKEFLSFLLADYSNENASEQDSSPDGGS